MVKGLDRFKAHFEPFKDHFVLIGGTACFLAMEKAGLDFRVTKDLDIVLCLESLNLDFAKAFWLFIRSGGYEQQQKSTGKKRFYRFYSPTNQEYPEMLELFSKKPECIEIIDTSHLTPIPLDDEVSSLSAILLDADYYKFIHAGKCEINGLPVLRPEYLIPMKARAWIDLSDRNTAGFSIDKRSIRKHMNDVIRLYALLSENNNVSLPVSIKGDMKKFFDELQKDSSVDLKSLGFKNVSLAKILNDMRKIYNL